MAWQAPACCMSVSAGDEDKVFCAQNHVASFLSKQNCCLTWFPSRVGPEMPEVGFADDEMAPTSKRRVMWRIYFTCDIFGYIAPLHCKERSHLCMMYEIVVRRQ